MADKTNIPPAKRKRVTKTFKAATTLSIDVSVTPSVDADGKVTFHVNSQSDKSKIYQIEYKVCGSSTTPRLVCNCGHQFGREDRDHCKHIAAVILYQMVQLSFANNDIKTTSSPPLSAFDETTLINMFKDLGAKVGGSTQFFKPATFKYEKKEVQKNAKKKTVPPPPAAPTLVGGICELPPPHPGFSIANPFPSFGGAAADPSFSVSHDASMRAGAGAGAGAVSTNPFVDTKPFIPRKRSSSIFKSLRKLPLRNSKKITKPSN